MLHQILPTVAEAYVTNRTASETGIACDDQMNVLSLSMDNFAAANFRTPRRIARATTGYVRSEQRIKPQFAAERLIEHFDSGVDQQNRQVRIREHVFNDTITAARLRIRQAIER